MITPPAASLLHGPVPHTLTNVLDWIGTLVFAFSGALVGVQKRFDLFGVLFLAFVVAVVGGMARDVLIGAVPPVAITHLHYFLIAIAGGLIIFLWYPRGAPLQRPILLFDAVGLSLFAVTGAQKALDYGIVCGTARDSRAGAKDRWRHECGHVSDLLTRHHGRWPRWVPRRTSKQICGLNRR